MIHLTDKQIEELEPCPFCGGEAERRHNMVLNNMTMAHCKQCGASAFDKKWNCRPTRSQRAAAEIECLRVLPAPSEWRGMPDELPGVYPFTGERMIVGWDDSASLPMHVELGRWRSGTGKGSGWCNTYGHSFSNTPTHYWPLPTPPGKEQEGVSDERDGAVGSASDRVASPSSSDLVKALSFLAECLVILETVRPENDWSKLRDFLRSPRAHSDDLVKALEECAKEYFEGSKGISIYAAAANELSRRAKIARSALHSHRGEKK